MGLMFAWATKEYLLWEMTIGQIVLYHNLAIKIKNGDNSDESTSLVNMDVNELRRMRDEAREQFNKEAELHKELEKKYGDIDE